MPLSISRSSAQDNRVAATDEAKIVQQGNLVEEGGRQNTMEDDARSISLANAGKNSSMNLRIVESGAVDLSGTQGAITINDGATMTGMADTFSSTVRDLTEQAGATVRELTEGTANTVKQALDQVSALAESKQTSGQAAKDKIVLYISLAGLALAALTFLRK